MHRSGDARSGRLDIRGAAADQRPAVGRVEDLARELGVQAVAGAVRHEVANHREADEREIAHRMIEWAETDAA